MGSMLYRGFQTLSLDLNVFFLREIETIIIFLSSPTLHHSFSMACNSLIEILEKKLASIILDYKIRESIIENLAWTN